MINANTNRPIIIVGKSGTGKTTKALEILKDPIIRYANEYDIEDNFSIPKDRGILIEDVHYKPNIELIIQTIIQYKGAIVLTSVNQKDVPKNIYDMCKLNRAGKVNYTQVLLKENGCANMDSDMDILESNIFTIANAVARSPHRERVLELLTTAKPPTSLLLPLLIGVISPSKLAWLDAKVKWKWSASYFYELLAYSTIGRNDISVTFPKRRMYDKRPMIAKKLGLRVSEYDLIDMLKQDLEFESYAYTKLSKIDRIKVGVKKQIVKRKQDKVMTLGDFI
jgi:hypothetical protein